MFPWKRKRAIKLGANKPSAAPDDQMESTLGHAQKMPGIGADIASTDTEVMKPSAD